MISIERLLMMGKSSAPKNMAIDEALLITQKELPKPTLRFYDWTTPAFSFGYFQHIASEVDIQECTSIGIQLVKRMTGGGTVVHGWDLTYSLILPRHLKELSVSKMYQLLCRNLVKAFEKFEITAECYTSEDISVQNPDNICLTNHAENDVIYDGKKLAGVSVRRNRNGLLFQGYISLDMPPESILKRVSKNLAIRQLLFDKSTAINTEGRTITRSSLTQAICETFGIEKTFNSGKLSRAEMKQTEALVNTKYASDNWNLT